jgi:hypothetical protein
VATPSTRPSSTAAGRPGPRVASRSRLRR